MPFGLKKRKAGKLWKRRKKKIGDGTIDSIYKNSGQTP
jgi:hypothetical protein